MLPIYFSLFMWGKHLHIITFANYLAWSLIETHETHSGFSFPVSPFNWCGFSTDSNYHNFHHLVNIGNYSSFITLWDDLFKTNTFFYEKKFLKKKD